LTERVQETEALSGEQQSVKPGAIEPGKIDPTARDIRTIKPI
jgi:hypothetical protein